MLERACSGINRSMGHISSSSSIYTSRPWGFHSEDLFLNQAVVLECDLAPQQLLSAIHSLENDLGRVRGASPGYSSRTIDIDILHWSEGVFYSDDLVIPHPLVHKRRFALTPLNEVGGELVHPVLKKPYSALLEKCEDLSSVAILEVP
jgi:2-amino-4-hydroxy-6-hydroxymethyldihydropteridine diphosphokinase